MFEDKTYETLLASTLENAPTGIDTRQGSIYYDAISGIVFKIAQLYIDLDLINTLTLIDTATGDDLDSRASEYGITRQEAISAEYYVTFEGTTPDAGERFYTDGLYFVLKEDDDGTLYLEAETAGLSGNGVYSGTAAIPVNNIQGLTAATFGEVKTYGAAEEDDDSLRTRVKEKLAGPAENGNKQHYKYWCESVEGVRLAKITPLWNGPNTVKAVLINSLGLPCSDSVIAEVQEYVDPATKGYTATVNGKTYVVGDGLGEGVANLGAHFTATGADEMTIALTFNVELATGYDLETAKEAAETAVAEYFKELALEEGTESAITVRVSAVGAILTGLTEILDYTDLTLNGGTSNIALSTDAVPVLGEVVINAV